MTAPFAAAGYRVNQLAHVAIFVAAAWLSVRLARLEGVARAAIVAPLLLLQPVVLPLVTQTMTEALFLVVVLLATVLWAEGARRASAAVVMLAPLVRPEGVLLLPVWSIAVWRTSRAAAALPWVGLAAWLAAGTLVYGDPFWLRTHSYGVQPGVRLVPWSYLTKFFDDFCGPVLLVLAQVGLWSFLARRRGVAPGRLTPAIAGLAVLVVFVVLVRDQLQDIPPGYTPGRFRHLLPVAPWVALLAAEGIDATLRGVKPPRWLSAALWVEAAAVTTIAVVYGASRHPYAPWLAALAVAVALTTAVAVNPRAVLPAAPRRVAVVGLLVAAGVFTLVKAPPGATTPGEALVQDVAAWYRALPPPRPRIVTALTGLHGLTGTDPWDDREAIGMTSATFAPGDLVIWDDWVAGRHRRIPRAAVVGRPDLEVVHRWHRPGAVPGEIVVLRPRVPVAR
jgi:hypothetical protein